MHQPTPSGLLILKVRTAPAVFCGAWTSPGITGGTLAALQLTCSDVTMLRGHWLTSIVQGRGMPRPCTKANLLIDGLSEELNHDVADDIGRLFRAADGVEHVAVNFAQLEHSDHVF